MHSNKALGSISFSSPDTHVSLHPSSLSQKKKKKVISKWIVLQPSLEALTLISENSPSWHVFFRTCRNSPPSLEEGMM